MPGEVVDEGADTSAPTNADILCSSPNVQMNQIELVIAPIAFTGEKTLVLLPKLARFTYLAFLAIELGQAENYTF